MDRAICVLYGFIHSFICWEVSFFFFLFFQLWLFLGYLDSKSWNAVYAIASAGQLDSEVKEDSLWPLVVM